MNNKIIIVLIFILLTQLAFSQLTTEEILFGVKLGITQNYDQALSYFSSFADKYPHDPAIPFFKAMILQSKMLDYESTKWENSFFDEIEQCIRLSSIPNEKTDFQKRLMLFLGYGMAYKSYQIAKEKKYLKSIVIAKKAYNILTELVADDSTCYDTYLVIGSYLYWRSYLTRNLHWLPFFSDQRQEGIALLEKSLKLGSFTKGASLSNLCWIYIKEKQYNKTIEYSQNALEIFGDSRFFLWPLGDAYMLKKDFTKAITIYQKILDSILEEQYNNHYNEIVLNLKIAQCYNELAEYTIASLYCRKVLELEPNEEVEKESEAKKKQANDLIQSIIKNSFSFSFEKTKTVQQ